MRRRRILKTRVFRRWALDVGLTDVALLAAVDEVERELTTADLGGGVQKKRVGVPGLKNQRANISPRELDALRTLAHDLLDLNEKQIDAQTKSGALEEITDLEQADDRQSNP